MDLALPTNQSILKSIQDWDSKPLLSKPEEVLYSIFSNKSNIEFDDVFIKVSVLNDVYNTNLYNNEILAVTDWISDNHQEFSDKLEVGDITAVWDLANNGTTNILFSFSTKFCSFSNPHKYPIYDSKVENVLWDYRKQGVFDELIKSDSLYRGFRYEIKENNLAQNRYIVFKEMIDELFYQCKLDEQFRYKGIDRFLWRLVL